MESEKVKDIKKVLEMFAIDNKEMTLFQSPVPHGESCVKTIKYADILTLINELERENERFKEKQSKAKEIMKNGELSKITKEDMYYYYLTNCGYLENEIERQKQIVRRKGEDMAIV